MKLSYTHVSKKRQAADLFVFGLFEKERLAKEAAKIEPGLADALALAVQKGKFSGASGEAFSSLSAGFKEASEAAVIGLGKKQGLTTCGLRKAIGSVIRMARNSKAHKVRILLDGFSNRKIPVQDAAGLMAETFSLGFYAFDKYRASQKQKGREITVELLFLNKRSEALIRKSGERALKIAAGACLTRDLINEPGNILNAQKMVQIVRKLARQKKIGCRILGPAELKRFKMGGILAVNQGSPVPPALIVTEYGARYKNKGTVCLVGKGVTFDTGGISIKPAKDMEKMKYDMSGAAAVIGAMQALSDVGLPVHVVALTPMVENTVSEDPQRPGDIIRMYNGKTVEVINTDAEGRLILADALAYTEKFRPRAIIDLATLTGMCAYTFGDQAIGMLGNDARLLDRVKRAGEKTGERCWELPLWDGYAAQIRGHHSDLLNVGSPYGGTITAAMFLKEFVPKGTPWVHLDIAGTAWCNSPRFDCPKGATGVGVKLLIQFLSEWKR